MSSWQDAIHRARAHSPFLALALDRQPALEQLLAAGKGEQALPLLQALGSASGRHGARASALLAQELLQRGDDVAALAAARRAVEGAGESVAARLTLGALLERGGQAEQALHHYRRAAHARPMLAAPPQALARALLRQGRAQEGWLAWVQAEQVAAGYRPHPAGPAWDGRALSDDRLLIRATGTPDDIRAMLPFVEELRGREPAARLSLLVPAALAAAAQASGRFEQVHADAVAPDSFHWQTTLGHLALLLRIEGPWPAPG